MLQNQTNGTREGGSGAATVPGSVFLRFLTVCFCWFATAVVAQAPISDAARETAEEKPLDLGALEVLGEGISFEQEFSLRLLRQALDKPKSRRQEDRDEWVCWIERATGSRFNYLNCARNGDLWALERPFGLAGPTIPVGGYGTILRSERSVNRHKLERAISQLEGPEGVDQEFISLVLKGERPSRDIPDAAELDAFAQAWQALESLAGAGASEKEQIAAIESAGLSLGRYNHIAGLTETYASVKRAVAARVE